MLNYCWGNGDIIILHWAIKTLSVPLQTLLDDAEACRRKMTNATALIEGLSGERIRWTEASKNFEAQITRLVGDVLLATGFLSYVGPFNQEFRNLTLKNWKKELITNKIPFSDVSMSLQHRRIYICCVDDAYYEDI